MKKRDKNSKSKQKILKAHAERNKEVGREMSLSEGDVIRHVNWNSIAFGSGNSMSCVEADEIIEEIMTVLISRKLTVEVAKRLLSETISSIDEEFVLEKRKIGDEII